MDTKVVDVRLKLENEYGSGYGTLWLLFCRKEEDASEWIRENLPPDYYQGDVWNQTRVQVCSYEEDRGSPFWLLLEAFAKKEDKVGPGKLRQIARFADWWPSQK